MNVARVGVAWLASSVVAAVVVACSSFGGALAEAEPSDAGTPETCPPDVPPPPCDSSALDHDSHHCGACGHDCLGGECSAGACRPMVIASFPGPPVLDLTVDAERVLWITSTGLEGENGILYACPKSGCAGAIRALSTPDLRPGSLASDGTTTYASFLFSSSRLATVDRNGALTELPGFKHILARHLEARADGLYYVAYAEPDTYLNRGIFRWADGGETTIGRFIPTDSYNTIAAAFTANRAYLGATNTGIIVSCPLAGCTTFDTFTTGDYATAYSMSANEGTVFWVSDSPNVLSCVEGATCTSRKNELSAQDLDGETAMAVTVVAGALFVQTKEGGLFECGPSACAGSVRRVARERELALESRSFTHTVTADAHAIYYAAVERAVDVDGGADTWRIMKVAR